MTKKPLTLKTRKIDGKRFYLWTKEKNLSDLRVAAKKVRKEGYCCRIVPLRNKKYAAYTTKRKN